MTDSLDVKGHERIALFSVQLAVVEEDLLTADNYILQIKHGSDEGIKLAGEKSGTWKERRATYFFVPAKPLCILGGKRDPALQPGL